MKTPKIIKDLLHNKDFTTPVKLYMATKEFSVGYDPYENNAEYDSNNLNPITIHCKVTQIEAEKSFFKLSGVQLTNVMELICENKYKQYFLQANKIEINDNEYSVYRDRGGQMTIMDRAYSTIRVTVIKK